MTATRQTRAVVPTDPGTPAVVLEDAPDTDAPVEDGALLVELAEALAQVRRGRFDVRLARRDRRPG